MRFYLKSYLILTGWFYSAKIFEVFYGFEDKSKKDLDLTMDDFFNMEIKEG